VKGGRAREACLTGKCIVLIDMGRTARPVTGREEVFWRAERRSKSDWSVRFLN
jgi:hypothetical protein